MSGPTTKRFTAASDIASRKSLGSGSVACSLSKASPHVKDAIPNPTPARIFLHPIAFFFRTFNNMADRVRRTGRLVDEDDDAAMRACTSSNCIGLLNAILLSEKMSVADVCRRGSRGARRHGQLHFSTPSTTFSSRSGTRYRAPRVPLARFTMQRLAARAA